MAIEIIIDDGGRAAAGFKGEAGDCVCRAAAIATGLHYREVYDLIVDLAKTERRGRRKRGISHPRTGVYTPLVHKLLVGEYGFVWTPTMQIGSGCRVHVRADELPGEGRHVLNLSRHMTALIDGRIHDTHDPSRDGTRCVYGYWSAP